MEYDSGLKAKYDYENTIAYAAEKAEIKGRIKGRIEGRIEGENLTIVKIATEMLIDGFPIEKIASITKLPLQEIQNLADQDR